MKNREMMIKKKERNFKMMEVLIFLVLTLILSVSSISAVGVSTPYWSTNPLKLQPGESTIVTLGLQNMVGTDDVTLRANLTKGNEIATIVDANTDYFVPLGSDNVTVNIEVKIPQNAEIEKTQNIEISFTQIASGVGGGFFTIASALTQRIPVLVVSEPTESAVYQPTPPSKNNTLLWIALVVIVLGIIIFLTTRKGKRKI